MDVKNKKRVFVAMSGGVDSSVAALLLRKQGYDVTGVFMRCYNVDGCAEKDAEDARRVAGHVGIPFYVWDFEEDYKKKVVEYMVDGYRRGLTPNPDVMCNREIKFGLFLKKALEMGADVVATGHYVRIVRNVVPVRSAEDRQLQQAKRYNKQSDRTFQLRIARDAQKDQSYFLWTLNQNQLKYCLFPIGDYLKPRVREMAKKAGLPTADKKDSQGICFLGQVTIRDFLKEYIPAQRGAVLTTAGEKIGEHSGARFYTIGQRHGLGLSDKRHVRSDKGSVKAHYVASKDVKKNTLVVAEGSDNPALYKKEVALRNVNFINLSYSLIRANERIRVFARVRYRQPLSRATLISPPREMGLPAGREGTRGGASPHPSYARRGEYMLTFDKPQKFVAEGQSAVFYSKSGEMLGGGVIV